MNRVAGRAGITILLALLLLAGLTFFICEYVSRADEWVIFSGSPHVYDGTRMGMGVLTDRDGALLLDMNGGRKYASIDTLRAATVHWTGDREGNVSAPILSQYALELAGYNLFNGVYTFGNSSGVAELTLSADVQMVALEAMSGYRGTIGVYNYKIGQLLCAVSTPTFDPDNVPEIAEGDTRYQGVYLNRFTQSTYIPGSIFKIVTTAAALETIPDIQEQTFICHGSYQMGADEVTCEEIHWDQSLKDAFRNSCNCAFAQIAEQLGADTLTRYVEQFGVADSISFDGITTKTGNYETGEGVDVNTAWSAIGQYHDEVNPCSFLTFIGAIAQDGRGVTPYLVEHIGVDGILNYSASTDTRQRIMSIETAQVLQEYMRNNVEYKYGDENFPGLTVCAKTGTGEVGGGQKPNAMIAGFVDNDEYPLAFIVAVEDGGYGRSVCVPILSKVLAACKAVLDS